MKTTIALFVFAAGLLLAGPLAASEAVWDLVVPTGLQPSAFVLPDPLPEPASALMDPPAIEPAKLMARQLVAPPRLPSLGPRPRSGTALFDANLVLMVGLNVAD